MLYNNHADLLIVLTSLDSSSTDFFLMLEVLHAAGKVVDRHYYNRNKHIFPASRWEVYDPDKNYETYTIHGQEVR